MSELTTLLLEEQRRAAKEALHPARQMAYELALAKRLEGRSHWWSRWSTPLWTGWPSGSSLNNVTARRAEGRMTPSEAEC